ncbi:MAG TPA: MerR family DNA-binding transcriptional regulator [Candidatus Eisenbacteria bacterium]
MMPEKRSATPTLRDYLTVGEAARLIGVSASTLRNWDRAGKLDAVRHPVNGYRLYRSAELEAVLRRVTGQEKGRGRKK